jgi:ABC-2 type transport system permease protein
MKQLIIKELKEFSYSYFGFGSMVLFIILSYSFLWVFPQSSYTVYGFSDPQNYFSFLSFLFLFIVPLISVGMITKEFSLGTFELLRTQDISWTQIVLSKFIALMCYITFLILLTLVHLFVLQEVSTEGTVIGSGQLFGSILGVILLAAVYGAISQWIASWLEHSIMAIIVSIIVCFLFYVGFGFLSELEWLKVDWDYFLKTISLQWHADQLSRGLLYFSSVIYTLSICTLSLYGAIISLARKNF